MLRVCLTSFYTCTSHFMYPDSVSSVRKSQTWIFSRKLVLNNTSSLFHIIIQIFLRIVWGGGAAWGWHSCFFQFFFALFGKFYWETWVVMVTVRRLVAWWRNNWIEMKGERVRNLFWDCSNVSINFVLIQKFLFSCGRCQLWYFLSEFLMISVRSLNHSCLYAIAQDFLEMSDCWWTMDQVLAVFLFCSGHSSKWTLFKISLYLH